MIDINFWALLLLNAILAMATHPKGAKMKQAAALTSFEAVLDSRDSGTYAHCQRTAKIALVLGRIMDLSHEQLLTLERGYFCMTSAKFIFRIAFSRRRNSCRNRNGKSCGVMRSADTRWSAPILP